MRYMSLPFFYQHLNVEIMLVWGSLVIRREQVLTNWKGLLRKAILT